MIVGHDHAPHRFSVVTRYFLWIRNAAGQYDQHGVYPSMDLALEAAAPDTGAKVPCYWQADRHCWNVSAPSAIYRIAPRVSIVPEHEES